MDHSSMNMTGSSTNSSSSSMNHGGMAMGGCKISMLWNWNTVDSCFISESWHVTSRGMFAGSCVGVILLVMTLEALRRSVKEFDRYLIRKHAAAAAAAAAPAAASQDVEPSPKSCAATAPCFAGFRPTIFEQAIRALLHMFQFAVAYFVMLLAMYYNGYFIICIFIGAYLGSFIFQWETLGTSTGSTSAATEPTVCCG
ncbi:uncharacterized protein E0L32_005133 [Thyridium curvatum]|uniref:Copper transport protein n=1 Tax=Thyridium curvatum TaxID=1093900 RepID=A0A507BDB3_9PEZI|nr:uncharacterized protein E0L32_005133 [Thyridium curvatum]TPX14738.1 hypothetical protein E0L32_005133 [Thyridium curvatum]